MNAALNVMRRMPPSTVENSLAGLIELVPDLTDDLLNNVDQPLKIEMDKDEGKNFILCDYNRDGDSYRSPWSNKYVPALDDGFLPSPKLRQMEIEANAVFDVYRMLYFDTGYSSVYFFNTDEKDDSSFGACFLIHKDVEGERGVQDGWWDSIHVFEVNEKKKGTFEYRLTSTIMVSMKVGNDKVGEVDLSGSMTQQVSAEHPVDGGKHTHITNLGKMLEDQELKLRNSIESIYIQKTREVVAGMRSTSVNREGDWQRINASLQQAVETHAAARKKDSD